MSPVPPVRRRFILTNLLFSPIVWGFCASLIAAACSSDNGEVGTLTGAGGGGGTAMFGTSTRVAGSEGLTTSGGAGTGTGGDVGGAGDASGTAGSGEMADSGGAASAGGAAGGAGAGGAPSACITSGNELCDDFETGQLDAKKWKTNKPTASATITLDGQHVHGGQFAVHIKVVPGTQSTAMITEAVTFPAASNSFYTRMFVYFSPAIPAAPTGDFHTGFIMGSGNNDLGNVQAGMGMIGSAQQFLGYSIFFANPKYEFGPWSATKIAPNQWLCVELFENGSDPATEIRQIWVNDNELTDLKSNSAMSAAGKQPNHLPPKFDMVSLGLWEYHPIPTLADMWIDDVRVSSKKIGCAN